MEKNICRYVRRFSNAKVLVLGDCILDGYLEGHVHQVCREAPVPVIELTRQRDFPGGAANTAVNFADLGAKVHFVSVTGTDREGRVIKDYLTAHGVDTSGMLECAYRRTLAKNRLVANGQILVRFDHGTTCVIDQPLEDRLAQLIAPLVAEVDAVVLSHYGYGIFSPGLVTKIIGMRKTSKAIFVGDAKDLGFLSPIGLDAVKPNYEEAVRLLGVETKKPYQGRLEQVRSMGRAVLEKANAKVAAVTLDCEGGFIFQSDPQKPPHYLFAPTNARCCAGAGDTFISVLTLALCAGSDACAAGELASAAASIVVSKDSTSTVKPQELFAHLWHEDKYVAEMSDLKALCDFHKQKGQRIVFTNGCFDILHCGHVAFLNRAKQLGHVLIVGVNSDESIRRLKGQNRPINTIKDRIRVLTALSCVDHVVAFEEDSPTALLHLIQPHIFAKGGDYTKELLPEAGFAQSLGCQVRILPYEEDYSTSGIISYVNQHRFVF